MRFFSRFVFPIFLVALCFLFLSLVAVKNKVESDLFGDYNSLWFDSVASGDGVYDLHDSFGNVYKGYAIRGIRFDDIRSRLSDGSGQYLSRYLEADDEVENAVLGLTDNEDWAGGMHSLLFWGSLSEGFPLGFLYLQEFDTALPGVGHYGDVLTPRVMLYLPGVNGVRSDLLDMLLGYFDLVFIPNYFEPSIAHGPRYSSKEDQALDVMKSAILFLKNSGVLENNIYVFGEQVGAFASVFFRRTHDFRDVYLLDPILSMRDECVGRFGVVLCSLVARDDFLLSGAMGNVVYPENSKFFIAFEDGSIEDAWGGDWRSAGAFGDSIEVVTGGVGGMFSRIIERVGGGGSGYRIREGSSGLRFDDGQGGALPADSNAPIASRPLGGGRKVELFF